MSDDRDNGDDELTPRGMRVAVLWSLVLWFVIIVGVIALVRYS